MAISINTIRQETYRLLNESTNSVLGQLPDGVGGTTVTSDATVKTYILDGIANICRTCVAYPVKGTYAVANNEYSTSIVSTATISPVGTQMWYPNDVYIGTQRLNHASEQSVRANNLNYKTYFNVGTTYILTWYRSDNNLVNIYPGNQAGTSIDLIIYGYGIPATPALDTTDAYTFLPDDALRQMAASYAAMMLVMKNTDDPSIASRSYWKQYYDEWRMKLWMQLDKSLKAPGSPYAMPPVTQAAR
jgi:hypothetical protein